MIGRPEDCGRTHWEPDGCEGCALWQTLGMFPWAVSDAEHERVVDRLRQSFDQATEAIEGFGRAMAEATAVMTCQCSTDGYYFYWKPGVCPVHPDADPTMS